MSGESKQGQTLISRRAFLGGLGLGLLSGFVPVVAAGRIGPDLSPVKHRGNLTRFIVYGDAGSGREPQYELAREMERVRALTDFRFAVSVGDNIYPSGDIKTIKSRFEKPYRGLLESGVEFYTALGNHDIQTNNGEDQIAYFHMPGRWYSFRRGDVEFFVLDSNQSGLITFAFEQLRWLSAALSRSDAPWKFAAMHHPLYSSQREPSEYRRLLLEPLFVQYGVDVVLAGHDHGYERIRSQRGVKYFVSGGGGGKVRPFKNLQYYSEYAESIQHFMLFELGENGGWFQTIDIKGRVIDHGRLKPRSLSISSARTLSSGSARFGRTPVASSQNPLLE
jgi:hypothetical protein